MAGKEKQATLAFCGFTKSVVTKSGKLYQVNLPEVVDEENKHQQQIECSICKVVQGGSTRASPSRRAQTNNNPCKLSLHC